MRNSVTAIVVACLLATSFLAGQALSAGDGTARASGQGAVVEQLKKLNKRTSHIEQALGKPSGPTGSVTTNEWLQLIGTNSFFTCRATWGYSGLPASSPEDCQG